MKHEEIEELIARLDRRAKAHEHFAQRVSVQTGEEAHTEASDDYRDAVSALRLLLSREGALQTNLLLAAADALSQYAIAPEYDCPSDKPIYVGEHCDLCGEMLTVQREFSAHADDCLIVLLTKEARSQNPIVNADFVQRCSDDLRASLDKFEERESATPSAQQNEGEA